jgi:eight-cysteine-cluster-containing protein
MRVLKYTYMHKYHTTIFLAAAGVMLAAVFYGMCQFNNDLESTFVVDTPVIQNSEGERVQNSEELEKPIDVIDIDETKPVPVPSVDCVRAGCSGQLCVKAGKANDIVSDCMYREEYVCYDTAICEQQSDGECGWTDTPALSQCLIDKQVETETL